MKWSVLKNTDELNLTPFLVGDTITYAWWVDNLDSTKSDRRK